MNRSHQFLIAELVICFSGVSFLLFAGTFFFLLLIQGASPIVGIWPLVLIIFFAGLLGLYGVFKLAMGLICPSDSGITRYTYYFVFIGIAMALLPAVAGIASANISLIVIGWSSILSAAHLIALSKVRTPNTKDSIGHAKQSDAPNFLLAIPKKVKTVLMFLLFLWVSPLMFLALWLGVRECAIVWFGFSLESKASELAQEIANGNEYCLIASRGAITFDELDTREIIKDAFNYRFGYDSLRRGTAMRDIHFGIKVEDIPYYWSFGEGQFVQARGIALNTRCAQDIQPVFFGARPL